MPLANKDFICASCGDEIKEGQRISIVAKADKKGKEIWCYRCNPETESAKIRITVQGSTISKDFTDKEKKRRDYLANRLVWQRTQ